MFVSSDKERVFTSGAEFVKNIVCCKDSIKNYVHYSAIVETCAII